MLVQETLSKLSSMRLTGMVECLSEQLSNQNYNDMDFVDRLSLMVDREETLRNERRFKSRIRQAKFKEGSACMENVDYKVKRNLSKSMFVRLGENTYIHEKKDIIFTGSTGSGKSWLAQALGHSACEKGFTSKFQRVPKLFNEIQTAKADGSYTKYMEKMAKFDVLILDDWGIAPFSLEEARDMFELIEERHKTKSTILTSQVPLKSWFEVIGEATIADAIMDRLTNNSYEIELLSKDSLRKSEKN